jgi:hypothetical protein
VDEDDPVALALLEVGRRDEHAEPQAGQAEDDRDGGEPGNHRAGQRVEGGRRGEAVEIEAVGHSRAIFKAAALAHGAKPTEARVRAASSDR